MTAEECVSCATILCILEKVVFTCICSMRMHVLVCMYVDTRTHVRGCACMWICVHACVEQVKMITFWLKTLGFGGRILLPKFLIHEPYFWCITIL